ncbi:MAG: hypothetical protein JTT11_08860 [Candidatus Brockarchaeota archaeon]|nr:hypothetical protein [Candidatus Brockarchaeota archaeon]
MASITVRVHEKLRREMRKLRHVNRSEVVRRFIEERAKLERAARGRNRAEIMEASRMVDDLYGEIKKRYGAVRYDSALTVRPWRDARYGASSRTRR